MLIKSPSFLISENEIMNQVKAVQTLHSKTPVEFYDDLVPRLQELQLFHAETFARDTPR